MGGRITVMINEKDRRIRNRAITDSSKIEVLEKIKRIYDIIKQGSFSFENEDFEDISVFEKEALSGNVEAETIMGFCYRFGKGVEQDENKSVKWFKISAAHGDVCGIHYLGICYYMGQGVEQDRVKAFRLQMTAASQGHGGALYDMGSALYYGEGVDRNVDLAIDCLVKAMLFGDAAAETFLISILDPEYVDALNEEMESLMDDCLDDDYEEE